MFSALFVYFFTAPREHKKAVLPRRVVPPGGRKSTVFFAFNISGSKKYEKKLSRNLVPNPARYKFSWSFSQFKKSDSKKFRGIKPVVSCLIVLLQHY